MRFRLRTLLIVLAILPPLLWIGWTKYAAWKAEQERRAYLRRVQAVQIPIIIDEVETAWQLDLRGAERGHSTFPQ